MCLSYFWFRCDWHQAGEHEKTTQTTLRPRTRSGEKIETVTRYLFYCWVFGAGVPIEKFKFNLICVSCEYNHSSLIIDTKAIIKNIMWTNVLSRESPGRHFLPREQIRVFGCTICRIRVRTEYYLFTCKNISYGMCAWIIGCLYFYRQPSASYI